MREPPRFLFVEDDPDDAELEERQLRAAGLVFSARCVENEAEYRQALEEFEPGLIICDYSLPGANGMAFLHISRELRPDVPFIFVSGTMGEDRAIEALRNGAADYLLKDRLASLPARVRRALAEAAERRRRAQLEEQLRQARKVEAIGRLAGGVAHDFNNILTIITGYTDLSLSRLPEGHPVRDKLNEIAKASRRAADLTRQLLAFGRKQIVSPVVLDLNAVVGGMEQMLRRLIGEDIELVITRACSLGRVRTDIGQLEQIIMNLAINARDAMPQGGRLMLETYNAELDPSAAAERPGGRPGSYVRLAVSDTGRGMSEETLDHLFEPFFTTKRVGEGTGLGLATVYGIVKQSGGNIWVSSEVGTGTRFEIYLPRVDEPLDVRETTRPRPLGQGSETVLLVEDDATLRELAHQVLAERGYTVIEAADGIEALRLVGRHRSPLHLVVADVVMPHMSGRALVEGILALRPGIKALYMSGYTMDAIESRGGLGPVTPLLSKPFSLDALAAKVREVLDS